MEKTQKIGAQIYGYTICIVAVITFLISITSLIKAAINLGNPLHAGWISPESPSLASYENYKMDILKTSSKGDETTKSSYIPDDQTLRKMYEAAKSERIQSVSFKANQSIVINSILIAICMILFITHWRWMQKNTRIKAE